MPLVADLAALFRNEFASLMATRIQRPPVRLRRPRMSAPTGPHLGAGNADSEQ